MSDINIRRSIQPYLPQTISLSHLVLDEVVADTVLFKDLPTIQVSTKHNGEWLRVE